MESFSTMSERTLSLWICYFLAVWARQYQLTLFEGLNVLFKDPFYFWILYILLSLKSNWAKTKQKTKQKKITCMWMSYDQYIILKKIIQTFSETWRWYWANGIHFPYSLTFVLLNIELCSICHSLGLKSCHHQNSQILIDNTILVQSKINWQQLGGVLTKSCHQILSVPWQGHTSYTRGNFSQ